MQGRSFAKAVGINFISKKYKNQTLPIFLIINSLFFIHNLTNCQGYNYVTCFLQFGYTMKHGCTCTLLEANRFY